MNILIINSGSSSLKYQLFDAESETVLCKGLVDRIDMEGSKIKHEDKQGSKSEHVFALKTHTEALEKVLMFLTDSEIGGIKSLSEISAV
jgi:acetate kinase